MSIVCAIELGVLNTLFNPSPINRYHLLHPRDVIANDAAGTPSAPLNMVCGQIWFTLMLVIYLLITSNWIFTFHKLIHDRIIYNCNEKTSILIKCLYHQDLD